MGISWVYLGPVRAENEPAAGMAVVKAKRSRLIAKAMAGLFVLQTMGAGAAAASEEPASVQAEAVDTARESAAACEDRTECGPRARGGITLVGETGSVCQAAFAVVLNGGGYGLLTSGQCLGADPGAQFFDLYHLGQVSAIRRQGTLDAAVVSLVSDWGVPASSVAVGDGTFLEMSATADAIEGDRVCTLTPDGQRCGVVTSTDADVVQPFDPEDPTTAGASLYEQTIVSFEECALPIPGAPVFSPAGATRLAIGIMASLPLNADTETGCANGAGHLWPMSPIGRALREFNASLQTGLGDNDACSAVTSGTPSVGSECIPGPQPPIDAAVCWDGINPGIAQNGGPCEVLAGDELAVVCHGDSYDPFDCYQSILKAYCGDGVAVQYPGIILAPVTCAGQILAAVSCQDADGNPGIRVESDCFSIPADIVGACTVDGRPGVAIDDECSVDPVGVAGGVAALVVGAAMDCVNGSTAACDDVSTLAADCVDGAATDVCGTGVNPGGIAAGVISLVAGVVSDCTSGDTAQCALVREIADDCVAGGATNVCGTGTDPGAIGDDVIGLVLGQAADCLNGSNVACAIAFDLVQQCQSGGTDDVCGSGIGVPDALGLVNRCLSGSTAACGTVLDLVDACLSGSTSNVCGTGVDVNQVVQIVQDCLAGRNSACRAVQTIVEDCQAGGTQDVCGTGTDVNSFTQIVERCIKGQNATCNVILDRARGCVDGGTADVCGTGVDAGEVLATIVTTAQDCIRGNTALCDTILDLADACAQGGTGDVCGTGIDGGYYIVLVRDTIDDCLSGDHKTCGAVLDLVGDCLAGGTADVCGTGVDLGDIIILGPLPIPGQLQAIVECIRNPDVCLV